MGSCMVSLMLLLQVPVNTELVDIMGVTSRHSDLDLVSSVIAAESEFDPSVTSPAGAQGIMQVMPKTGGWIREAYSKECGLGQGSDMYNPGTNISYGSCYLKVLHKKYKGDLIKTILHYHSGGGGVRKLYKHGKIYPEARAYVQRVLKYYFYCRRVPR